jgi:glycosyltransferase involved in cell wall biosynthesis
LNRISSTGFYFCIGNLGTLLGVVDFILGRKITRWEPIKADPQGPVGKGPPLDNGVRTLVVDLSTRFGGASARALGLLKAFPRGETALAGLKGSPVMIQARALGIEVHVVGTRKTDPAIFPELITTIKSHGFHLLDPQNIQSKVWCTLAAMKTGSALVSTLNSWYESELKGSFKGSFYQWLEAMTAKRTDLYIAVSLDIRKRLLQKGIPENRIAYIPNAISIDRPLGSNTRKWLGKKFQLPDQAFVCCAVGRLVEAKGYHHLINAFSRLSTPEICCLIVGDGHLKPALLSQIRTAGLDHRVRLAGHLDRATVLDLVTASDLFVMPSLSEGTPLAILEAAALCRPIIASRVGGIPEMLHHKRDALLIPPGDEQRLARAIQHLHDHPQQAEALARNACHHVAGHFGISNQVQSTRNAYHQARRMGVAKDRTRKEV